MCGGSTGGSRNWPGSWIWRRCWTGRRGSCRRGRRPGSLLLLDEPTASLDPDTGDWVRTWLERYRDESGCTILLASHNMAEVHRLCSDVLMLKQGRIVDHGTPDELLERYGREDLEEVFLDIARERRGGGGVA